MISAYTLIILILIALGIGGFILLAKMGGPRVDYDSPDIEKDEDGCDHEWIVPERSDVLRGTDAIRVCKNCRKLGTPEEVRSD